MTSHRTRWLVGSMALAVALVAALAFWDQQRESALALDEFAEEQATLAQSAAAVGALRDLSRIEVPGERLVLLQAPGARDFTDTSGRRVESDELRSATGLRSARLSKDAAARLGLPARSAWAGLSRTPGGGALAVVTTGVRDRDRARRATARILLSTLLAAGLVLIFGGLALREQRRELVASRSLALAQLEREREERLERESRAATVVTLASGVAHELATPLGVIVGRAEQLQPKTAGDERASKAVQTILDQAERIRDVIRGFLGLARGKPPAMASLDPRAVVEGALQLVEHRFTKAGVKLAPELPNGLPQIRCDQRLLEHAIVNLLLNACDATPPGGGVAIAAHERAGAIEFSVQDSGAGIAEEIAARATEPFFSTKGEGRGLGLAIASEIAKTHRGSLDIARGAPSGTRVSVRIPLAAEEGAHA